MATHFNCKCSEREKPVDSRAWVITQYKHNSSAFVKKGGKYSDWSQILCLKCGGTGRSKAKYVDSLECMDHSKAWQTFEKNQRQNRLEKTEV